MMKLACLYPLVLVAVLGCDTKAANKANLEKGLEHYLQHMEPCPGYTSASFPITTAVNSPRRDLEALAGVDLVSKSQVNNNGAAQIQYPRAAAPPFQANRCAWASRTSSASGR